VVGAPVEYVVNRAPGRTIVTVVNNSGTAWNGKVLVEAPHARVVVREYVEDVDVPHAPAGRDVVVTANVPAYDLKVYAFEAR
jgi:hypothetical protein